LLLGYAGYAGIFWACSCCHGKPPNIRTVLYRLLRNMAINLNFNAQHRQKDILFWHMNIRFQRTLGPLSFSWPICGSFCNLQTLWNRRCPALIISVLFSPLLFASFASLYKYIFNARQREKTDNAGKNSDKSKRKRTFSRENWTKGRLD